MNTERRVCYEKPCDFNNLTLDGVMQAPGSPEEDPSVDLSCRGWAWETLIRSRHRADRFNARENKNYPEWRDDEYLQARGQDLGWIVRIEK